MPPSDDHVFRTARDIVEHLSSGPDAPRAEQLDGFHVMEVKPGLLLCRWDHALGLIQRAGEEFSFVRTGQRHVSFRTTDVDEMLDHLVEVVASVLRQHNGGA